MMRNVLIAFIAMGLLLFAACTAPADDVTAPDAPEAPADVDALDGSSGAIAVEGDQKAETTSRRELAAETNTVVVEIRGFSYDPDEIVVPAGTVITFINEDHQEHTVTSEAFDSGPLTRNGGQWQYTFSTPGTYEIHSEGYGTVKGTIIVE